MNIFVPVVLLNIFSAASAATPPPTGLLVDFKPSPSLGVRLAPRFGWIVPPCDTNPDQTQTAYELIVTNRVTGATVWDSGKISSNESIYAPYSGPSLSSTTSYNWTVSTWTENCASPPSEPSLFITGPFNGFDSSAEFITTSVPATFGYFRKEVSVPTTLVTAVGFIAAYVDEHLLSGFKVYINDNLVALGPGRGEAPVFDGDGLFRNLPLTTLDLTPMLSELKGTTAALALQTMHNTPKVILQIIMTASDGSVTTIVTNTSWSSFNGDLHRFPGPPQHGSSAGTGFLEYIDARGEPINWRTVGFVEDSKWVPAVATPPSTDEISNFHPRMERNMAWSPYPVQNIWQVPAPPLPPTGPVWCGIGPENSNLELSCWNNSVISDITFASFGTPSGTCPNNLVKGSCDASSSLDAVKKACVGKTSCSVPATNDFFGGDPCVNTPKQLGVQLKCPGTPPPPPPPPSSPTAFIADFGKEFQGGLILTVPNGVAGTVVSISCGEKLINNGTAIDYVWGWQFTWTLRDGAQVLEQHKYMECRWAYLEFAVETQFTLSAWRVNYPWVESDSSFTSDNATLNAVYDLCRYTLYSASLDTYTDSNTRERTVYEADGMIAMSGRLVVQRDYLYARHSHAFVIQNPTWPVEWKQLDPFLGYQDYMATGQTDLAMAFTEIMHERTQIGSLNASNGLLNSDEEGSHITDWMPDAAESDRTQELHEFTYSNHLSVSNAMGARGLELLAEMVTIGGGNASVIQAEAAALKAAIIANMWDPVNGTFCDGVCSEVHYSSLLMTNMFLLSFGFPQTQGQAAILKAWNTVTNWGIYEIGDYGAFWYQLAVASSYYSPYYATPDDGTAMVTALSKCDHYSWCSGLQEDNLTMTRESWHDGTYSHGWGTSALVGVNFGILGIHQLSPGFSNFLVQPKLGPLKSINGTMPTIRGFITVSSSPGAVDVSVPCNSKATLCLPRSSSDSGIFSTTTHMLTLDGTEVQDAVILGGHLCMPREVSCGVSGEARKLRFVLKK